MIRIFFLLSLSFGAYAWSPPKNFNSASLELEEKILQSTLRNTFKHGKSALETKLVDNILKDYKNRIDDDFAIPEYFDDSVRFWFSIYTQYSSDQAVIHDKDNLEIVYNVIDFTELKKSSVNKFTKARLQAGLSLEYSIRLKKSLYNIGNGAKNLSDDEIAIKNVIEKSRLKVPKNKTVRKRFYRKLAQNIRVQTGQRDMIYRGVLRATPYFDFFDGLFKEFNLPHELLAIPFLESSFNPKAHSKADAVGAWQFMPYIASLMMPARDKYLDYRYNTLVSSVAALHLLRENKMILKRWDLAVTAYNSGTKHLVRARRKFAKKNPRPSLEYILENYKHAHLGFASKNFYSEFLALVHVLAYKESIYKLSGTENLSKRFNISNLNFYITKCNLKPMSYYKALQKSSPFIHELNFHLRAQKLNYSKAKIVVSDIDLTSKKYFKVPLQTLLKKRPKYWPHEARKLRCGR